MKIIELLKAIIAILEILLRMGIIEEEDVSRVAKGIVEEAFKKA